MRSNQIHRQYLTYTYNNTYYKKNKNDLNLFKLFENQKIECYFLSRLKIQFVLNESIIIEDDIALFKLYYNVGKIRPEKNIVEVNINDIIWAKQNKDKIFEIFTNKIILRKDN